MNGVVTILATVITVLTPALVYVVRITSKWSRFEEKLSRVLEDVATLAKDRDALQVVLVETMKKDREATDLRLRWLENNLYAVLGAKVRSGD